MTASIGRRLALFPISTTVEAGAGGPGLAIGGCSVASLATEHGTPLYLFDAATLDAAAGSYIAALAAHYPGPAGVTYAGKAFLCRAVARWAQQSGLWVDCTGEGEIAIAAAAGVGREQLLVHGVNKSAGDLAAAVAHAGVIVVDNPSELRRLAAILPAAGAERPALWLRVRPGVAVETPRGTALVRRARRSALVVMGCALRGVSVVPSISRSGSKPRSSDKAASCRRDRAFQLWRATRWWRRR